MTRLQSAEQAGDVVGAATAFLDDDGGDTTCVLVVDDEPGAGRLLDRILQLAGIGNAHGVTDARQAVRRWLELEVE